MKCIWIILLKLCFANPKSSMFFTDWSFCGLFLLQVVVPILEYLETNVKTLHSLVVDNNFKRWEFASITYKLIPEFYSGEAYCTYCNFSWKKEKTNMLNQESIMISTGGRVQKFLSLPVLNQVISEITVLCSTNWAFQPYDSWWFLSTFRFADERSGMRGWGVWCWYEAVVLKKFSLYIYTKQLINWNHTKKLSERTNMFSKVHEHSTKDKKMTCLF